MNSPIEIALRHRYLPFLNTGHHFFFVPFANLGDEAEGAVKEFIADNCPWVIGHDGSREKNLLWLRGRVIKRDENFGLLVAIETNIGSNARGWATAPIANPPPDTLARQKESASSVEPYIFADIAEAPRSTLCRNVLFTFPHTSGLDIAITLALELEFPSAVAEPLNFDLIVDFGNTRTVVLAIEQNKAAKGFLSQICRPIIFTPRSSDSGRESGVSNSPIIDSWFVLAEPLFGCLEPPNEDGRSECPIYTYEFFHKTERQGFWLFARDETVTAGSQRNIPQSCVQMSPAVMGVEGDEILGPLPLEVGGNSFLSSPKRYSWDNDPVGSLAHVGRAYWTMSVNTWNPRYSNFIARREFPKLAATVLQLMDESGADWSLAANSHKLPTEREVAAARPPHSPNSPSYPRSDALTWAALYVLESAYRDVMSDKWRAAMEHQFVHRRLRNVLVTYPSGWTAQELSSYRAKWQKALDIFTTCHLDPGATAPKLLMDLDEAVASQLPIIYGEIVKLGNSGENWFELVGRGKGTDARARIMNMDIGGGTTDVAIIEYFDEIPGPGIGLNAELLHKDSSTVAGDLLVRRAIEAVLLPAIASNITSDRTRRLFAELLSSAKQDKTAQWNRVTRQVLIPIIREWLRELTETETGKTQSVPLAPINMLSGDAAQKIRDFNNLCADILQIKTVLPASDPLGYDKGRLESCIKDVFTDYLISMTKVFTAFDCDFLIVSGKPSELTGLKDLILKYMPVPRSRIVFSHNYQVGAWYPLSTNGQINDAKTVTVAGAALYLAIRDSLLPGWMIRPSVVSRYVSRNYWGLISQTGHAEFKVVLPPEEDEATVSVMIEAVIGRRALPTRSKPDPVYRLRWSVQGRLLGTGAAFVKVTLRRNVPVRAVGAASPFDSIGEYLELVNVEGSRDGVAVQLADLQLQLCTLDESDYWIDAGIFHIDALT